MQLNIVRLHRIGNGETPCVFGSFVRNAVTFTDICHTVCYLNPIEVAKLLATGCIVVDNYRFTVVK